MALGFGHKSKNRHVSKAPFGLILASRLHPKPKRALRARLSRLGLTPGSVFVHSPPTVLSALSRIVRAGGVRLVLSTHRPEARPARLINPAVAGRIAIQPSFRFLRGGGAKLRRVLDFVAQYVLPVVSFGFYRWGVIAVDLVSKENKLPGAPGVVNSRSAIYRTHAHLRRSRRIGFLATNLFTEIPYLLRILNITLHVLETTGSTLGNSWGPPHHEGYTPRSLLRAVRLAALRNELSAAYADWRQFQKLSHIFNVYGFSLNSYYAPPAMGNHYYFTPAFPLLKQQWTRFGILGVLDFFRATPMASRRVFRTRGRSLPISNWFIGNIRQRWLPAYSEVSFYNFVGSLRGLGLRTILLLDPLLTMKNWIPARAVGAFLDWVRLGYEDWWVLVADQRYMPTQPRPRVLWRYIGVYQRKKNTTRFSWRLRLSGAKVVERRRQWYTRFRYDRFWRHRWAVRRAKFMYIALRVTYTLQAKLEYTVYKRLFTLWWRRNHWRATMNFNGKYRFYWIAKPRRYRQRQKYNKLYRIFDKKPPRNPITVSSCHGAYDYSNVLYTPLNVPQTHRFWPSPSLYALEQFRWRPTHLLPPILRRAQSHRALRWSVAQYRFFSNNGPSRVLSVYTSLSAALVGQRGLSPGALTFSLYETLVVSVFKPLARLKSKKNHLTKYSRRLELEWRVYSQFRLLRMHSVIQGFFKAPYNSLQRYRQKQRLGRASIKRAKFGRTNTMNMSNKFTSVSAMYAWYRPRKPMRRDTLRIEEHVKDLRPRRKRKKYKVKRARKRLHTASNFYFGGRWLRWQLSGSKGAYFWRRRSGTQNVGFRRHRHSRKWDFALARWTYTHLHKYAARRPLWTGFTAVGNFDKSRSFLSVSYFKPLLRYRQRHEWAFNGFQLSPSLLKNKPYRQRNAAVGIFKIPGQNIFITRTLYKSGLKRNHKFRLLENAPIVGEKKTSK